ncbi:hypothetical protein DFH09DRAFT_1322093 [Mycena vulgaris]|nr:hypothetical protein DFH09DRAFT_1322093 [Mycena vulgaris]
MDAPTWAARPQVEMFQCLAEHSLRWEEFSVELTPDLVPLLATLRNRLPLLRRLWIQLDGPETRAAVQSIDCFQVAPHLVDFGITNEHGSPVPILLPARQFTRYQLDGPWQLHQSILTVAPNLVEIRLELDIGEDSWVEHGDTILLLCLRRLFISHTQILNRLRAPALKELAFYHDRDDDPDHLLHIEPFVGRSGCTLQRLTIKGVPTADITTGILHKYPSLTELFVIIHQHDDHDLNTTYQVVNTLISHLTTHSTESARISPQLTEIRIGCHAETYIDYALCLNMLKSRWKSADCALKSAAVLTASGPGPDSVTVEGLIALRRDGLDLILMEGSEAERAMDHGIYSIMWA